jgi:predicted dehydrogenase
VKFLVIGLGSMGKRRVRNMQALGHQVAGFDPREDRRIEATTKYNIPVFESYESGLEGFAPDGLVISTSPSHHMQYAFAAVDKGLPCFIEASVVDADKVLELSRRVAGTSQVVAPSCTMRYFPGPKLVKDILGRGLIGKPLNFNYQTGQYLPDWHPWEDIQSFYVSARETGGGREIVPFELTWLNDLFGDPDPVACLRSKVTDMDADIDDIYHCLLRYPGNFLGNMTVEVVSRPKATRELRILGSDGILVMSADENCVRYINTESDDWKRFELGQGTVESGYINPEEPYISEMADFAAAAAASDPTLYSNSLFEDWKILNMLNQLDKISELRP